MIQVQVILISQIITLIIIQEIILVTIAQGHGLFVGKLLLEIAHQMSMEKT